MTEESGLDRRDALKTLLALGAAAPLAWTGTLPAQAAGLTSQQLAGQRVIYSYSGLTPPSALLQQISAGQAAGGMKTFLVTLGLLSVVLSWIIVHTVYALRYARAYYSEPAGGVEFNEEEPPTYTDFAYFAFTVGMTYQVADTNITSKVIRRTTLHHAFLSYLFGAVLLGLVINVVATLLK